MTPSADEAMAEWWSRRAKAAASPRAARDLILVNSQVDVRRVLSTVTVPTLVLHRTGDIDSRVEKVATSPSASRARASSNWSVTITSRMSTRTRSSTR
jgi:hypothetical protein